MFTFIFNTANGATDTMILIYLAIVLCAFFFEDLVIVVVGLLAADGIVPVPSALLSLYIGITMGDISLYSIGAFARTHPRLAHYIEHDFTASFRSWFGDHYAFKIFSGHFIPGMRFTTYLASGFFRRPLSVFIPTAMISGATVLMVLFSVSYWFGSLTTEWIGEARWGVAGIFLLVLFFLARHNLLAYRAKRSQLE